MRGYIITGNHLVGPVGVYHWAPLYWSKTSRKFIPRLTNACVYARQDQAEANVTSPGTKVYQAGRNLYCLRVVEVELGWVEVENG